MARIILKGNEQVIAAGIGNSTNASNARLVRVYNPGGGSGGTDPVQVHIVDPTGANEYSGIGSCTVANKAVEYFEKQPSYNVYAVGGAIHVTSVGYGPN
jgi:hypothetical protein